MDAGQPDAAGSGTPGNGAGQSPGHGEQPRPERTGLDPRLALLALPLAAGAFLGQQIAYTASRPGLEALGAIFILGFLALLVIVTAIVGLGAAASRNPSGRAILAAAGLLIVGGVGGNALSPILGLTYRPPVTLVAPGTTSASIDSAASFVARPDGFAECRSVVDGLDVAEITALDLGELGAGTLRATLSLPQEGLDAPYVELLIDGADIPAGQGQPMWHGTVSNLDISPGGTSGTVTFDARLSSERGIPGARGWPATLSGRITWACGPWGDPNATPPPPIEGFISLDLQGADWVALQTPAASCEVSPDGSVSSVASQVVGSLQGAPVTVQLALGRGVQAGGSVTTFIVLAVKDPPPGERFIPNWDGQAAIAELGADARSGYATFRDLPSGVEPSVGPPPAGWPTILTGAVRWECR